MNLEWLRFVTEVERVIFSTAYGSLLNFHFVGIHLDHCWPVSGKGSLCILAWLLSISTPLSLFPISTSLIATFPNMLHNPKEAIYRNISNSAVTKQALFPSNRSLSPGNHSYVAVCSLVYSISLDLIFRQANDSKQYKSMKASVLQQLSKQNLAGNILRRLFQKCLEEPGMWTCILLTANQVVPSACTQRSCFDIHSLRQHHPRWESGSTPGM